MIFHSLLTKSFRKQTLFPSLPSVPFNFHNCLLNAFYSVTSCMQSPLLLLLSGRTQALLLPRGAVRVLGRQFAPILAGCSLRTAADDRRVVQRGRLGAGERLSWLASDARGSQLGVAFWPSRSHRGPPLPPRCGVPRRIGRRHLRGCLCAAHGLLSAALRPR